MSKVGRGRDGSCYGDTGAWVRLLWRHGGVIPVAREANSKHDYRNRVDALLWSCTGVYGVVTAVMEVQGCSAATVVRGQGSPVTNAEEGVLCRHWVNSVFLRYM